MKRWVDAIWGVFVARQCKLWPLPGWTGASGSYEQCVATVWGKNLSAGPASQAAGNHGAPTYYFPTLDIFEQNQTLLLDAQNTTIEHTKPLITIRHFDIITFYI